MVNFWRVDLKTCAKESLKLVGVAYYFKPCPHFTKTTWKRQHRVRPKGTEDTKYAGAKPKMEAWDGIDLGGKLGSLDGVLPPMREAQFHVAR